MIGVLFMLNISISIQATFLIERPTFFRRYLRYDSNLHRPPLMYDQSYINALIDATDTSRQPAHDALFRIGGCA